MSYHGVQWTPEEPTEEVIGNLDRTPADTDPCVFCGREHWRHEMAQKAAATAGVLWGAAVIGGIGYGAWRLAEAVL